MVTPANIRYCRHRLLTSAPGTEGCPGLVSSQAAFHNNITPCYTSLLESLATTTKTVTDRRGAGLKLGSVMSAERLTAQLWSAKGTVETADATEDQHKSEKPVHAH